MGQGDVGRCLNSDTVIAYVAGQLAGQRLERVDEHVACCDECALVVAAGALGMEADVDAARPGSARSSVSQRFEVLEVIGRGGMATVHRGRDRSTGLTVAIKRLRAQRSGEEAENVARFAREVTILRRLDHPNIVRIHASVVSAEEHLIVMEYVPGGTLRTALRNAGALAPERAVPIVLELSDALARAHHLGVIHRDIKPENVLLAADGSPRLADFGLARLNGDPLTTGNVLLGTLPYLSPEALAGARLDEKADVWALGVMLFEMLAGRRPFDAETPSALVAAIAGSPLPDLASALPGAPRGLVSLLGRLLARDRAARPGARELGASLEAIGTGDGNRNMSDTWRAPAPQTVALPPRRRLPVATTPFVGRTQEVAEVVGLLEQRETRLVTIVAPGGMGKSRLAIAVAEALHGGVPLASGPFRDGIAFVDLTLIDSPALVASAVASALSLILPPGGDAPSLLLSYLSEKQLLLIMDNFEHVAPAAAFVAELLAAAPEVQILVTSRQALLLSAEIQFALGGMRLPDGDGLGDDDASALFGSCARRVLPQFDGRAQRADVARVCRLVQGMPLGIVLAAAWVNVLGVGEVAQEIVRSLDFLRTERADVPERQRSVRAIFDHSWALLSEADRDVFARLSVFHGGFSRRAAEAVGLATPRQLANFADKSLISWHPPSARYDVHELLRQFGESELSATFERHADTMNRLVEHVVQFLGRERILLEGPLQRQGVENVEAELGNVRAAWSWMLKHRQIEAVDATLWGLVLFHYRRGSRAEADAAFASVIETFSPFEAWGAAGQRALALALALRAILAEEQGRITDAVETLEQARRLLATAAPGPEHGLALIAAGWLLVGVQSREACLAGAERGLEMFRASGDSWALAFAGMLMARVYYRTADDPVRAEACLAESIALQRRVYGEVIVPSTLGGLGMLRRVCGDGLGALAWFSAGLEAAERLGDLWTVQDLLQITSHVQLDLGDFEASEASARRCLELARETGSLSYSDGCQLQLGDILSVQGRLAEAEEQYARALRASAPGSGQRAAAGMHLAELARRRGQPREAERGLTNSLAIFEALGTEWGVAAAAAHLGELACDELRFEDARQHCRRALGSGVRARRPRELFDALCGVARLASLTGRRREAAELCGLVQSHPALYQPLRSLRLEPLLRELGAVLAPAELEAALERGRGLDGVARASALLEPWGAGARPAAGSG